METQKNYKIRLSKGKYALVSAEDYPELSKYSWYYGTNGYANRGEYLGDYKTTQILMHRHILGAVDGDVDHINRDRLDNRRENLRVVPHYVNGHNRDKQINNTSGFKGVSFCSEKSRLKRWVAKIKVCGKNHYLGRYHTPEEANSSCISFRKELSL